MTSRLPAAIVPRLQQLVRMLASENDGEALSAVRATGKTLAAEGKSFHDLAEALQPAAIPSSRRPQPTRTPDPDPPKPYWKKPKWDDLRIFEKRDWLKVFLEKLQLSPFQKTLMKEYRVNMNTEELMYWQPSNNHLHIAKQLLGLAWKTGLRP